MLALGLLPVMVMSNLLPFVQRHVVEHLGEDGDVGFLFDDGTEPLCIPSVARIEASQRDPLSPEFELDVRNDIDAAHLRRAITGRNGVATAADKFVPVVNDANDLLPH